MSARPSQRKRLENGQQAPGPAEAFLTGVILLLCCLAVVVPFLGIISTSLSSARHLNQAGGFVLWPDGFNLDAYRSVLSGGVVTRALIVSIGITTVGTILSLSVSAMMAYGLSRPGSFGHRPILMVVLFSLLFSPGLIPLYLTVKQVGLLDSYWSLILPGLVSAFNIIVLRAFFMNIPAELFESARIDGATDWSIFTKMVLPLSKPVLAVIGLFYAVGYWNAFFGALIYLSDQGKWPLTLVMRTYVLDNAQLSGGDLGAGVDALPPQPALQMAMLLIAVAPILFVYPFLQKHFTTGMLTGAVKG
ncbi:carbohydrate ABC transporter permease [Aestuariimicrobium sp. p3-SID1156]|uniref:carbohydrate ABC transporter permease n=1 Tax=Aestuariimicrobium sp. p3-SID1156 TaxID=2916038 RepID=UPI00223BB38A|nr:carbohydrate ABC transporter permease [Aestuariimicrobium sp. p3-SID1156]MCT1458827.1 carbohydrate ABC transporter permease [Aestuariimicrobium sp. p3-SID1156]